MRGAVWPLRIVSAVRQPTSKHPEPVRVSCADALQRSHVADLAKQAVMPGPVTCAGPLVRDASLDWCIQRFIHVSPSHPPSAAPSHRAQASRQAKGNPTRITNPGTWGKKIQYINSVNTQPQNARSTAAECSCQGWQNASATSPVRVFPRLCTALIVVHYCSSRDAFTLEL